MFFKSVAFGLALSASVCLSGWQQQLSAASSPDGTGPFLTQSGEKKGADKDKSKDKGSKNAKQETHEVTAKVVKVDTKKHTLTAEVDGKKVDYQIGKDVKFTSSTGASEKGLADARLSAGSEIKLVVDATGKQVKEVQLPDAAPAAEKDKKATDKNTDKKKKK